jgi:hypothetical protein
VVPVVLLLNDTNIMWYGVRIEHQHKWMNTNKIDKT